VPNKPSSLTSTDGGFTPTTSMVGLGEKLGMDSQIGQSSCYRLCRGPFSREQWLCPPLLMTSRKDDTYGERPYADRAWEACGVLVGFFPVWCTSIRIAVTLGYEYRLFVVVIT
jgi:hypothetical protein